MEEMPKETKEPQMNPGRKVVMRVFAEDVWRSGTVR